MYGSHSCQSHVPLLQYSYCMPLQSSLSLYQCTVTNMYGSHSCQFQFSNYTNCLQFLYLHVIPLQTPAIAHTTETRHSVQNDNLRPFPTETIQISCLMQYFSFFLSRCLILGHHTDSAVPPPRHQIITQGHAISQNSEEPIFITLEALYLKMQDRFTATDNVFSAMSCGFKTFRTS